MPTEDLSRIAAESQAAKAAADRAEQAAGQAVRIVDGVAVPEGARDLGQMLRAVTNLAADAEREAGLASQAAKRAAQVRDHHRARGGDPALDAEADAAEQHAARAQTALTDAENARKEAISIYAVEEELKVKKFFEVHREAIYKKLEECDEIAAHAPTNTDMIFIAESLPIINSIIHVGSDRKTLGEASSWVRDTWGDEADPLIVLSALLFIYVANKGAEENLEDPVWRRIHRRVQKLLVKDTEPRR